MDFYPFPTESKLQTDSIEPCLNRIYITFNIFRYLHFKVNLEVGYKVDWKGERSLPVFAYVSTAIGAANQFI